MSSEPDDVDLELVDVRAEALWQGTAYAASATVTAHQYDGHEFVRKDIHERVARAVREADSLPQDVPVTVTATRCFLRFGADGEEGGS